MSTDPLAEVERLLDEHAACGYSISQTGYWVTYECGVTVQGRSMTDAERAHIAKVLASDWLADIKADAVQAERERIAAGIEWEAGGREAQSLHARDEDVEFFGSKQRLTAEVKALRDAARIARDGAR